MSIPETTGTVEYTEKLRQALQRDCALRQAAQQARTRYAGEVKRIDKGLVIALNGGVTLLPNGTAQVRSASDAEIVYHVAAGTCDCPDYSRAPDGRCKHRYAACLVRKAQKALAEQARLAALAADTRRYYASYSDPAGITHVGTVVRTPSGWLFVGDDGEEPLYVADAAVALGGQCALAEDKRGKDEARGGLVALITGYAN